MKPEMGQWTIHNEGDDEQWIHGPECYKLAVVPLAALSACEEQRDDFKTRLGECQESRDATQASRADLEIQLARLKEAVRPVLAAYRVGPAHITEEQITGAWEAFDAKPSGGSGD